MSTTLYLRTSDPGLWPGNDPIHSAKDAARGVTPGAELYEGAQAFYLNPTIGSGAGIPITTVSVAGPTAGIFVRASSGDIVPFLSAPLAADITISGTVSFALCGLEASMNANATFRVAVYRVDETGAFTLIINSLLGTELTTANARHSWTGSPTSTAMKKGDRLLVLPMIDDATSTTMGSGHNIRLQTDGDAPNTADSNIQFTENLTFLTTAPSGTTYYLRDTAAAINPGSATEKTLSTTQGSGTVEAVHTTVVGPLAFPGDQWTVSAGGTDVEWYTPPLDAFTVGGAVRATLTNNAETLESIATPFDAIVVELAIVDADGTNPVVWAQSYTSTTQATSSKVHYLTGPDTSVGQGKRLRLRIYQDDMRPSGNAVAGTNRTIRYDGTSTYASNLTFTQTITEAPAAAFGFPFPRRDRRIVPLI